MDVPSSLIDGRVLSIADQFNKQNDWNEHMQQGIEAMAERADEVMTLRETVAMLETRVNEIYQVKEVLVERKPAGRLKRSQ
ncbi:hypothetical protein N7509_002007 [Penicillium cosmopolitanum]|uniref:Uncharacterized protein n=1 Tax=Penicillium cosmopolitanum TaxID=1131564 RepID=A0A9W9W894_9EURO|nr:uncharacterized protein N7509_002007 [Penicillium cosmopolitanum]KAJ5408124.1 hypothetical protein N7509_002007 [Penicillium cosmopolitanum]